ncbi:MAG: hypothetical protein DA330_10140 [Nitrososphaera sp.]|nr:hypothetical protein [Nitrososphaera sp.]
MILTTKVLDGYGLRIYIKDRQVIIQDGNIDELFGSKPEPERFFLPRLPYARLVITGFGNISTGAIKALTAYNVDIP